MTFNFKRVVMGIFLCYALVMIFVTVVAFKRSSGVTGLDPSQIVQIREKDNQEKRLKAVR